MDAGERWLSSMEFALLAVPFLSWPVAACVPQRRSLVVGLACVCVVALTCAFVASPYEMDDEVLAWIWPGFTYGAYCVAACLLLKLPSGWPSRLAKAIVAMPVAAGFVVATFGAPMLAAGTWGEGQGHLEVTRYDDQLVCERGYWGFGGQGGQVATMYRTVPGLPIVRRPIAFDVQDVSVDARAPEPKCETLLQRVRTKKL